MYKLIFVLALVLFSLVPSAVAGEDDFVFDEFYTTVGGSSGKAIDSSAADTAYFQYPNTKLDSMILYVMINSAAGTPEVSCKIQTTPDEIADRISGSARPVVNATRKKAATWTALSTVFSNLTTEATMTYYGIGDSTAMSAPGKWGRVICYTDADHAVDGIIQRLGILKVKCSR